MKEFVQVYDERYEREYGFWRPVVAEVIQKYLECGDLTHGFARICCDNCGHEYLLLYTLFDTGAQTSEIATVNLDYFDAQNKTLIILGKGNAFRQISLCLKTAELLDQYINHFRRSPKPLSRQRLFIN